MNSKNENQSEKIKQEIHAEGEPEKVFQDIFRFKQARELAEKKGTPEPKCGPAIMVLSGTQRGVYSGGGVTALEKLGLSRAFKNAFGVSTGAPVLSYLLSNQAELGTSIYYEENVGKEFINLRPASESDNVVDITWLCEKVFKGEAKKLDIQKVLDNPTHLYFSVTEKETGKSILVDAKKLGDLVEGIRGSAAIPELYKNKVVLNIDGKDMEVVDGAIASPFPVEQMLEKLRDNKPTSILVFANRPKFLQENLLAKILQKYESLVVGGVLGELVLKQDQEFERQLEILKNSGILYTIVWTDDAVGSLERRPKRLKKAAHDFEKYVYEVVSLANLKVD